MKLVLMPGQWKQIKKALGYTEQKMIKEFIKGGYIPIVKGKFLPKNQKII